MGGRGHSLRDSHRPATPTRVTGWTFPLRSKFAEFPGRAQQLPQIAFPTGQAQFIILIFSSPLPLHLIKCLPSLTNFFPFPDCARISSFSLLQPT